MSLTFNLSWSWVPPAAVEQVRSVMDGINIVDFNGEWREVEVLATDDSLMMGEFTARSVSDSRSVFGDGLYLDDKVFVAVFAPVDRFVSDGIYLQDSTSDAEEFVREVDDNLFTLDSVFGGVGEIILDQISIGDSASATLINIPHTCAGANRLLMVGVVTYIGGGGSIPAVNYNGVTMTALASTLFGQSDNERLTVFYLANPSVGSHTIAISVTPAQEVDAAAVSFVGAHQSSTLGIASVEAPDSVNSLALDVSSDSDDLVIDFLGWYEDPAICLQNQIVLNSNVAPLDSIAISTKRGDSIVNMGWTLSGGAGGMPKFPGHIGVSIHNLTTAPQNFVRSVSDSLMFTDTGVPTITGAGHFLFVQPASEKLWLYEVFAKDLLPGGSGSGLTDGVNATVNVTNTQGATTTIFDDCSGGSDLSNLWNYTWHAPQTGQWVEKRRVPTSADIPTATVALPHTNNLTQYICGCVQATTADSYADDVIIGTIYTKPAFPFYSTWAWYARHDAGWVHQSNDHNDKFFAYGSGGPYVFPNWYGSYQAAPPQDLNYPGSFFNNTSDLTDGGWNDDSTITGLYTGVGKQFMNSTINPALAWHYREIWIKFTSASDGYIKSYTSSPGSRALTQVFNYVGVTDPWAGSSRCEAFGGYSREKRMNSQWKYWADVLYDRQTGDDVQVVFTNNSVYASSDRFSFQPRVSRTASTITFKFRKGALLTGTAYGWARSIRDNQTVALGSFVVN